MAVDARIFRWIVCIWVTSSAYGQTITGTPQDYEELSKAVDRFLDILIHEDAASAYDRKTDTWENVHNEDIDPKLKILAQIMQSLSSRQQGSTSLRDQLRTDDYISMYLQAFRTDGDPILDEPSSQLPSFQINGLDRSKTNNFWADNPATEDKRNGIWYGKRAAKPDGEPSKRNGIWYGKRSSPVDDKRNGIWYGKRNGIWYGKRNGIWYGKRDSGLYSEDVM